MPAGGRNPAQISALGDGDTVAAGEIGPDLDTDEARRPEQSLDSGALIGPDLEHEPASRPDPSGAASTSRRIAPRPSTPANTACGGSQSRTAGSSSGESVATYGGFATARSTTVPVGRASNHEPSAMRTLAAAASDAGEVGPRHVERIGIVVDEPHRHSGHRELIGEGEPDRARAGPQVGDRDRQRSGPRQLDGDPGDDLGLGPGDQHAPVDGEVEVAERPPAEDVGERFTGGVPGEHRVEVGDHPVRRRLVEHVVDAIGATGDLAQPPGRRPLADPLRRLGEQRPPRDGRRVFRRQGASASWRARSSAASAATTSSSAPASTSARR